MPLLLFLTSHTLCHKHAEPKKSSGRRPAPMPRKRETRRKPGPVPYGQPPLRKSGPSADRERSRAPSQAQGEIQIGFASTTPACFSSAIPHMPGRQPRGISSSQRAANRSKQAEQGSKTLCFSMQCLLLEKRAETRVCVSQHRIPFKKKHRRGGHMRGSNQSRTTKKARQQRQPQQTKAAGARTRQQQQQQQQQQQDMCLC